MQKGCTRYGICYHSLMQNVLKAQHLSYYYGPVIALDDVSFAINRGDYVGIIGPNGSGKSTLMRLILGLLSKQEGSVHLFGTELRRFHEYGRIGYVPQKATALDPLFPTTVREVVAMGMLGDKHLPKMITKADDQKITAALELVDMSNFKERRIGDLSGGQQQRVFIARALITDPELLILDEPVTGVDAATQQKFYQILRDLNRKQRVTIIFITHDIASISQDITKLLYVHQRLLYFGTADKFCGVPEVNPEFAEAQHHVCHLTHHPHEKHHHDGAHQ